MSPLSDQETTESRTTKTAPPANSKETAQPTRQSQRLRTTKTKDANEPAISVREETKCKICKRELPKNAEKASLHVARCLENESFDTYEFNGETRVRAVSFNPVDPHTIMQHKETDLDLEIDGDTEVV